MNSKYLKVIIYSSIFSVAYGGFFYQRYTIKDVIAAPAVAEDHMTASSSLVTVKNTYADENETANNSGSDNVPDMSSFRREKPADDKNTAQHVSSFASRATYATGQQPSYRKPVSYAQENSNNPAEKSFTVSAGLNYSSFNTSSVNTISASVTPDNSPAAKNLLTAVSNTSNNGSTKTFVDPDLAESDGSEFLPDGSSQQDLFTSQSKNPRVYTIKDYQTADISCVPGYDDSSPHAKLMRGLKGC